MSYYQLRDVVFTNRLVETFGNDIELTDDQGHAVVYRLLKEFQLGAHGYAVLQSQDHDDEDVEIFRVMVNADGQPELETIEDDEEWENISELYDELTLPDAIDEP